MSAALEDILTIRPAAQKDFAQIIMLARRIWPAVYKDILTREQIDNMLGLIYTTENLTREMMHGHQFWLAFVNDEPVAYASVYNEGDYIWIKKLYVAPEAQGKKIGVKLMHGAVSSLLPAKEIRVLANPNNIPAHNFYTHLGFLKIAEVPVQMGDFKFNDFLFSMPIIKQ